MRLKSKENMAKNTFTEAKPNTIVSGTEIKGEIKSDGDFRIDGKLIGSIFCKGKIVIGQTGTVEGDITCKNADLSGKVKGTIKVEQLLSLKATTVLHGDIVTDKLSIEPGAMFSGSCQMDGNIPQNNPLNGKKSETKEKVFG